MSREQQAGSGCVLCGYSVGTLRELTIGDAGEKALFCDDANGCRRRAYRLLVEQVGGGLSAGQATLP